VLTTADLAVELGRGTRTAHRYRGSGVERTDDGRDGEGRELPALFGLERLTVLMMPTSATCSSSSSGSPRR
jgi:hypothetical protein